MQDTHFLQSHSLFGGITDEQMQRVIPHLKEEHFNEGQVIVLEGDEGDRIYFICEGSVEVLKEQDGPNGPEQEKLAKLQAGDTFGEMELIDIQHRAATVRAVEPVTTVSFSNKDLYQIYHEDMKVYTLIIMNLAREISRRLRKMDALVASSLYSHGHGS